MVSRPASPTSVAPPGDRGPPLRDAAPSRPSLLPCDVTPSTADGEKPNLLWCWFGRANARSAGCPYRGPKLPTWGPGSQRWYPGYSPRDRGTPGAHGAPRPPLCSLIGPGIALKDPTRWSPRLWEVNCPEWYLNLLRYFICGGRAFLCVWGPLLFASTLRVVCML